MRVLGAALAGVAVAGAAAGGGRIAGFGMSVTLQPGWVGHTSPGELDAIAPRGAFVQLAAATVSHQRYLALPRRLRAGTTRCFVRLGGRTVFLYVHAAAAQVAAAERVLASISAWASTAPYDDGPDYLPPEATLAHTGRHGIVVWVGLSSSRFRQPVRRDPLDLGQARCTWAWEGAIPGVMQCVLWSSVPGRYDVSIYVYVKRRSSLAAAQAELRRLALPTWSR